MHKGTHLLLPSVVLESGPGVIPAGILGPPLPPPPEQVNQLLVAPTLTSLHPFHTSQGLFVYIPLGLNPVDCFSNKWY